MIGKNDNLDIAYDCKDYKHSLKSNFYAILSPLPCHASLAGDIHITPGVNETLLISTIKFAEAGYVTIFDRNEVNIYNQHDTVITVS
jgi:hypothetical protein